MAKKKTSSHFQAAKDGAEKHNERLKELPHICKELSYLNEQWKADNFTTVSIAREAVEEKYHKAQGKKLPKNATPIQETVVVIQEGTTMEQLQNLATKINEVWGYTPLAIYIHRDEGHKGSKEWKPNLHAHMIFDTTDENGKTLKPMSAKAKKTLQYKFEMLQKERAARGESVMKWEDHPAAKTRPFDDLQDITAECLDMERGKPSDIKHLSAIQFKIQKKEEEVQRLNKEIEELKSFISTLEKDVDVTAINNESDGNEK